MPSVLEFSTMGMQIIGGRVEDGRAANDGRIDKPLLSFGVPTRNDQSGFRPKRIRLPVVL